MYLVRHAIAADNDRNTSEVLSLLFKCDSELMMNRSTKQMKRGSDHAVTKT
jgi:hypothetical protein